MATINYSVNDMISSEDQQKVYEFLIQAVAILIERDVGEFALNIKSTNGIETKVTLSIDQKKKRGE
jgi:hypothetical protein